MTITDRIADVFRNAGTDGWLHARDLDGEGAVDAGGDEPVITASTFKVPVLVTYARMVAAGELDPAQRVRIAARDRVVGPTGLSVFAEDAEWALADLATSMITVSDNTATDVVMRFVGRDRINQTMRELGLTKTYLVGDCRLLLDAIWQDLGFSSREEYAANAATVKPERLLEVRSLRASETNRTTPREMTSLLAKVWRDEAGPADACAIVRRAMGLQIWPHRLTSGFPEGVAVSGKTGTLPGIRNEAGVVEYPGGGRYAVAVFTRSTSLDSRNPPVDRSIGESARLAVDHLRGA